MHIMYSGNHEPKRVAGVEANSSLPEDMPPPVHDIQGGDETDVASGAGVAGITTRQASGMDSHRSRRSRPPEYDSLPWACVTCGGWVHHLERVHTDEGLFHQRLSCLSEDRFEELVAKYGCYCDDVPRVTPEEKREAHQIAVALEPGDYDSDDLDRIQATYEQRMRDFEKAWETYP